MFKTICTINIKKSVELFYINNVKYCIPSLNFTYVYFLNYIIVVCDYFAISGIGKELSF